MNTKVPAKSVQQYLPPGYRKKHAYVGQRTPGPVNVTSYWDGGSRDEYLVIRNGQHLDVSRSPGFPAFTAQIFELMAGDVFVRHGTFRGKPSTAMIETVLAA